MERTKLRWPDSPHSPRSSSSGSGGEYGNALHAASASSLLHPRHSPRLQGPHISLIWTSWLLGGSNSGRWSATRSPVKGEGPNRDTYLRLSWEVCRRIFLRNLCPWAAFAVLAVCLGHPL